MHFQSFTPWNGPLKYKTWCCCAYHLERRTQNVYNRMKESEHWDTQHGLLTRMPVSGWSNSGKIMQVGYSSNIDQQWGWSKLQAIWAFRYNIKKKGISDAGTPQPNRDLDAETLFIKL